MGHGLGIMGRAWGFVIGVFLLARASGQATLPGIDIRTIAEVETKYIEDGRTIVRLSPAIRVVPGDQVVYTVEIRNQGADALAPQVTQPVPAHMAYVADSATGPGADITYSIGGVAFDHPDGLKTPGPDGKLHPASASNYTHIRWQFRNTLKSKSVAYARFRAVVK